MPTSRKSTVSIDPRRRPHRASRAAAVLAGFALSAALHAAGMQVDAPPTDPAPLVIGDTFSIASTVLGEKRRINVYRPPPCQDLAAAPCDVLYMLDGGLSEDFLHVAGLTQVLVGNGGMRPSIVVGIENIERRRDLTGPTEVARDKAIARHVGGSVAFRTFIHTELFPEIERRYRTSDRKAIVGESLAGLFVVETLLLEPGMFDTYIAIDPSLWWNDRALLTHAPPRLASLHGDRKSLYLASSREPELAAVTGQLAGILAAEPATAIDWHYEPMPEETHATIYHPAALKAFRAILAPQASVDRSVMHDQPAGNEPSDRKDANALTSAPAGGESR